MDCLARILRARLILAKKMNPDARFYFMTSAHTLSISLSNRRLREIVAATCPDADVESTVREFHAIREILEHEAKDKHVERLDTYMNVIPLYDDPARIKMIKDVL